MSLLPRSTFQLAAVIAVFALPASTLHAQSGCQCEAPGGESSRIANAIGGGLFAGLIAAVIPFHHAGALAAAPAPAASAAPNELTMMTDSTDIAPNDSTRPRALASANGPVAPGAAGASPDMGGYPVTRTSNGESALPLPTITSGEAATDGLIAPRTATLLPALAMLGVGAMLSGIFFLRVRRPRLRSR
jgi:hypothetical protein